MPQIAEKLSELPYACDDSELPAFLEALDDLDMLLREARRSAPPRRASRSVPR